MNPAARVGLLLVACVIALLGGMAYQMRMEREFSSRMVVMAMLGRDGRPVEGVVQFDPEATVLEIAHHTLVEKRLPLFLENLRAAVRDTMVPLPQNGEGGDEPLSGALAGGRVTTEDFVRMMDLPQMARVLGVAVEGDGARDGRVASWVMTDGMARNLHAEALRRTLLPDDPDADLQAIRQAARGEILRGLSEPGILKRDAWMHEVHAVPYLQACGLFTVVGDPDGADARWWKEQVKTGLRVGTFDNHLLPLMCGIRAAGVERGMPEMVLHVLVGMIEVEYRARGQGTMHAVRKTLVDEIEAAGRELRRLEGESESAEARGALLARQLEGIDRLVAALRRGEPLPVGWEIDLPEDPALQGLVTSIQERIRMLAVVEGDIEARTGEARTLRAYLDDPAQQVVTVRVKRVVKGDSELLRALREELREKEMERTTLLQRATPAHPLVKALAREITELEGKIALHDVPEAPVYETEQRTNPKLVAWRRDLSDLLGTLAGLSARGDALRRRMLGDIRGMRTILEGKSEAIRERRMLEIRAGIEAKTRQLESLEERAMIGAGVEAVFEVYTQPLPTSVSFETPLATVYGVALGVGCLVGLLLLLALGTERGTGAGHMPVAASAGAGEPSTRLPVLGTIHSFE